MRLLAGASGIAFAAFGAVGAQAAGTASGSTITNVATVNFSVGGVAQTPVTGTNNFTVDRRITLTVFYVANIPVGETNGEVAGVTLTAQAREAGAAATQGAIVAQTVGANTAGVDTVFADTAGFSDIARDGQFSARDDYTVSGAVVTVTKTSTLLWDPLNGNTNPKNIPGAVIEYCIAVNNGAGAATATGISVSDPMPKDPANPTIQAVDYYGAASANAANGDVAPVVLRNVDGTATCTGGAAGGSLAGTAATNNEVVSGVLSDITASTGRSFRFRARIR